MSALSEEFQQARQYLRMASDGTSYDLEVRKLWAAIGTGHAILATAAPGTAGEARNDERLVKDVKAAQN